MKLSGLTEAFMENNVCDDCGPKSRLGYVFQDCTTNEIFNDWPAKVSHSRVVVVGAAAPAVDGVQLIFRECMSHVAVVAELKHVPGGVSHLQPLALAEIGILAMDGIVVIVEVIL